MSIVNPINLDYCGKEICSPGFQFGPYVRECYVLHMVFRGRGVLEKGGRKYELSGGQAFLIRPGEETLYRADKADPWEYMWIGFHGCRAEEFIQHMGFEQDNPVIDFSNVDAVRWEIGRILNAKQLTYVNEMTRMSALYELMALLSQDNNDQILNAQPGRSDSVYVQTAVEMMLRDYNKRLKITDVADVIGISRSYLTSIFKKELKVSPQEFLMNFRMEKAAQLLEVTKSPVNIIAAEVGYSDSLSFSKAFKRRYGMSPTDYREHKPELVKKDSKGAYTSKYPL